jgi:branched-chain amino acid transport system ATP-binding protein
LALLRLEGIDVRFGGVRALEAVDLEVEASRVTGLIGPNGAGKTTLFNVACGLQGAGRGAVFLDDRDITGLRPHRRARLGLARTFQRLEVFGSMTVHENVLVAAEIHRLTSRRRTEPRAVAESLLQRVGLSRVAHERVDALPTGTARLVELARALATSPRVLLLDEPSSGLDESETKALGELLTGLARDGLALLLVEHDVELVMTVCEQVAVLDFGRLIATGSPSQIRDDPAVQAAYLGTLESDDAA